MPLTGPAGNSLVFLTPCMGQVLQIKIDVEPITREEWRSFWKARQRLSRLIALRRKQLELLEQADQEWDLWKNEIFAKLAAGAAIEDEGRIA